MASGPISSWQIDGETMETVTDLILGGSKITADGDCSHEIKTHLFLVKFSVHCLFIVLVCFSIVGVCMLVAQSFPTLCNPMDCGSPGSSVHGILQARILEWVAVFLLHFSMEEGLSFPF